MNWAANLRALSAAVLDPAAFGEPVTLPGGAVVNGIFDPVGTPAGGAGFGSETGLRGRLSAQANPTLDLADADAAGLSDGAAVQVRGASYLITRLDPDGAGITRLLLMPAAAASAPERIGGYR